MGEKRENILRDGERVITFFFPTSNELNTIAEVPHGYNMHYSSLSLRLSRMSSVFLTNWIL